MRPYSMDLRRRVVAAWDRSDGRRIEIALGVTIRALQRLKLTLKNNRSDVQPRETATLCSKPSAMRYALLLLKIVRESSEDADMPQ